MLDRVHQVKRFSIELIRGRVIRPDVDVVDDFTVPYWCSNGKERRLSAWNTFLLRAVITKLFFRNVKGIAVFVLGKTTNMVCTEKLYRYSGRKWSGCRRASTISREQSTRW